MIKNFRFLNEFNNANSEKFLRSNREGSTRRHDTKRSKNQVGRDVKEGLDNKLIVDEWN